MRQKCATVTFLHELRTLRKGHKFDWPRKMRRPFTRRVRAIETSVLPSNTRRHFSDCAPARREIQRCDPWFHCTSDRPTDPVRPIRLSFAPRPTVPAKQRTRILQPDHLLDNLLRRRKGMCCTYTHLLMTCIVRIRTVVFIKLILY